MRDAMDILHAYILSICSLYDEIEKVNWPRTSAVFTIECLSHRAKVVFKVHCMSNIPANRPVVGLDFNPGDSIDEA
jgi:hypothetical protein